MPIVQADVKGLEVVAAAQLSLDPILCKEILDKEDIHENNRDRFQLGEGKAGRLIAKIFKFRLIYGGSAYSYAHDPDFMGVSTSEKFWQGIIDEYYNKYKGIKEWHDGLVLEVMREGFLEIPSGRIYRFQRKFGKWPLTTIKNYPVQGFGADLVKLARLEFCKRLKARGLRALFIGTIHDSLLVDCPEDEVTEVAAILTESIASVPALVKKLWSYDFFLPLTCEVSVGPNKKDLTPYPV